ncbi:hypothetical protein [Selenomonas sp. oral taxon 138]|uniref:hypothetical protein n=1 Tax=Selenomonas sp. oral taxon 138 TaxID=712532 RepID=UPI0002A1E1AA|nr:hypothetical protein [Selenomonas sp. oral taxon 138]EKX95825.1 hypothetical protein HMPREF9163_02032 [Selenomonas sp. oral taxon 138 str. F0429]
MNAWKKTIITALAAFSLTASASAAPAAIDTEAQLDVMAASGVIQEEINTLYHTWDGILKSGMAKRSHYTFYAAVTDLNHNGRLELLISRHFLNRDPLYYAGDGISEEQKKGLKYLCDNYPSQIYGAAYEISEDGTTLEPYAINNANTQFPDLTRLHIRGKNTDGHYIYMVDTQRMPRDESWTSATDRYGIVYDAQILWADVDLGVGTNAHAEGTAGIYGEQVEPFYTSMQLLYLNKDVDPYGSEAEAFLRNRLDSGRRVSFVSWQALDADARAALASSWYGWSYEN